MHTNSGQFYVFKIELDGHYHGSPTIPRQWVARICGLCPKYGLAREFLDPMNDWTDAHRAMSGNIYGRVARYMLRDGNLYEVCRLRGNSCKRHLGREFIAVDGRKRKPVAAVDALARADGLGPCAELRIPEDKTGASWVAHITGLGTPDRLGFVVSDDRRTYRLQDGLFEVVESGARRLIGVRDCAVVRLSDREALQWLA